MIVPHRQLSPDALAGVIEEFVTRDGTETTDTSRKSAAVMAALDHGELVLVYDPESDTCNILAPDDLPDEDPREVPDDEAPGP